jgi:rfaE bifunctional protein nucleotidyltransferase chain/domain
MLSHPKIVSRADLAARLPGLRPGKTVVFTNGCFDLLHPGHVDLLARAAALGDLLILGLNADASVARLKGPARPVTPFAERAYVLAGLASVDFVTGFEEDTPRALIAQLLPDVVAKGGDWPVEAIVGGDVVAARGGRVVSLPLLPGFSTTRLIERIANSARGRS